MNGINDALSLDPKTALARIKDFLHQQLSFHHRTGALIGLSGGLDSSVAAAAAVHSLGSNQVHLVYLPDRDSHPLHGMHARKLANHLGIPLREINITTALRSAGIYKQLPIGWIPDRRLRAKLVGWGKKQLLNTPQKNILDDRLSSKGNAWIGRGNAYASSKHRMRALILYRIADRERLMVIGAANRTEWLTGTFSKWGCDHCADCMPLLHLFRSQLPILAEHLEVPNEIIHKPADPDILPGLGDKGSLLGSFSMTDMILWALENHIPISENSQQFPQENVALIRNLVNSSRHMREAPYSLL